MDTFTINRRQLLKTGFAAATSLSVAGAKFAHAADSRVRMVWWGSEERARRTNEAVDAFEAANKGIAVETEFMGWDDYWPRLATQGAGGNAPDFIQMDYRYMFEYARRNAILPLNSYLGSVLKIEDFGKVNLDSCSVDGTLYGANVGVNSFGALLDEAAWQEAGVEPPTFATTWEQFAEKAADFARSGTKKTKYAVADASGDENLFEGWLRQRGKTLYDASGALGYHASDAAEWFEYWAALRASGGCVPADIQALYKNTIDTSPLTLGHAALDFAFSNQFVGFQKVNKATLSMTAQPVLTDGKPGQYLKPSQMFSISAKSEVPEVCFGVQN